CCGRGAFRRVGRRPRGGGAGGAVGGWRCGCVAGQGDRGVRAVEGGRPDRGVEGLREVGDGGGRGTDGTVAYLRVGGSGGGGARRVRGAVRGEGRRAGRGQGRGGHRGPCRGAGACGRLRTGGRGGVPRGAGGVAVR